MKLVTTILMIITLAFAGTSVFAQSATTPPDSLHVIRKNDKSVNDTRDKKQEQNKKFKKDKKQDIASDNAADNSPDNINSPDNRGQFKKLINARPDMTKMRGARPPEITRPFGPLLPRGIGKPGGAFRPGGH